MPCTKGNTYHHNVTGVDVGNCENKIAIAVATTKVPKSESREKRQKYDSVHEHNFSYYFIVTNYFS